MQPIDLNYSSLKQLGRQQWGHVNHWPTPFDYNQWYLNTDTTSQLQNLHPQYYTILYQQVRTKDNLPQSTKLSRGQKLKQKKKQLKQQLQEEQKKIGQWVKLQRKDLLNSLQKIKQKEQKIRKKKQKKLSHLIEIHKEIYKHRLKKGIIHTKIQPKRKKKKFSHLKKMKEIFQKNKIKTNRTKQVQNQENSEGYLTVSQQQQEEEQKQYKQSSKKQKQKPSQIVYKQIGKLTGKQHNGYYLRQWVDNVPSNELQDISLRLINRLAYKQAMKQIHKPQKARKLILSGIHECKRTLRTIIDKKKSKIIIISLNIERNNLQKGIDDEIQKIIDQAKHNKIPIAHTSTRTRLGRAFTGKFGPKISVISIINFQGYQDMMEQLMINLRNAKEQYQIFEVAQNKG